MEHTHFSPADLAQYIDHTLLRPEATEQELKAACDQAREYGFSSVCVYWHQVGQVAAWLAGCHTRPIAVVGFPEGDTPTATKVEQTRKAVESGAVEIDMVLNRTLLLQGDLEGARLDIHSVVEAAPGLTVKVILETSELSEGQKRTACELAEQAGARFVKTSTGFSRSGATTDDVALMRSMVGNRLGVKASGGIRSTQAALSMIAAGASRLGTSASVDIVRGVQSEGGGY